MSVTARMNVSDVDRHEGFDMIKMDVVGPDGLDGSLELSVSDPSLVGSVLPGTQWDLCLEAHTDVAEEEESADETNTGSSATDGTSDTDADTSAASDCDEAEDTAA